MNDQRKYAVHCSGHGIWAPMPTVFDKTKAEAQAEATHWKGYANTIGGDACVVEAPGKVVPTLKPRAALQR